MLLPKTCQGLNQIRAEFNRNPGVHRVREVHVAPEGTVVGRVKYVPGRHPIGAVDPIRPDLLGGLQARVRRPKASLPMNVLVYGGRQPDLGDRWQSLRDSRDLLLTRLTMAAIEAIGIRELGHVVLMGQSARLDIDGAEIIANLDKPEIAAEAMAEVSEGNNFNILISDNFGSLINSGLGNVRRKSAIAIKADHPIDVLGLPGNVGVISLTGFNEVDTDDPSQLNRFNTYLSTHHQKVLSALRSSGIFPSSVIYDPSSPHGFNTTDADNQINSSIREVLASRS
ncbi:MAG: hypothetical protein ACYCPS_04445 [Candidatus Saccharimonadales bacterium]